MMYKYKVGEREWVQGDHYANMGLVVPAGSPMDNTSGGIGICWVNVQYDESPTDVLSWYRQDADKIEEIKAANERLAAIATEKKAEKNCNDEMKEYRERKRQGYCQKCHSYCYGDCNF